MLARRPCGFIAARFVRVCSHFKLCTHQCRSPQGLIPSSSVVAASAPAIHVMHTLSHRSDHSPATAVPIHSHSQPHQPEPNLKLPNCLRLKRPQTHITFAPERDRLPVATPSRVMSARIRSPMPYSSQPISKGQLFARQ